MENAEIEKLLEEIDLLKEANNKLRACLDHMDTKLDTRFKEMDKDLSRAIKLFGSYDEDLWKAVLRVGDQVSDAFLRIKNIELKFFPNLGRDIDKLYDIIGDPGDIPECRHERRDPKKKE